MKSFTLMFLAASAFLFSGCVSFDYTGRSFAPHDDDAVIAWHTGKNPVPAGKYRVIGKGELKYKAGSLDGYDVEERLIEEARKRGADAVLLEKNVSTRVSSYETDNAPDPAESEVRVSRSGVDAKGEKFEINSFDDPVKLRGTTNLRTECTVYAVFYKKSADVQKFIESCEVRVADGMEPEK